MNTSCSMAVLAALAVLAPRPAAATEQPLPPTQNITAVSPSASTVAAGALETITISGVGKCGTFLLDLGDATPIVHLPGNFPIYAYHAYAKPGTYKLKAEGQGDCTGAAGAHVDVVGPSISSMFLFSQVTPGGEVLLQGQNFGNLPGQLLIHLTHYLGHPIDRPLQNLQWGDTFAAGTIPDDISGVLNQQATFTVVTQSGAPSNMVPAQFTAGLGIADLADHLDRVDCSHSGTGASDQCMGWGRHHWPLECGSPLPDWGGNAFMADDTANAGLGGYHGSGWGNSSGSDQFFVRAPLKNGWVLDSESVYTHYTIGGGDASIDQGLNNMGSAEPKLGVNWNVGWCNGIWYGGRMIIKGPMGVPF